MSADMRVVGRPNMVAAMAGMGDKAVEGRGVEEAAAGGGKEGAADLGMKMMEETKLIARWKNFTNVEPKK